MLFHLYHVNLIAVMMMMMMMTDCRKSQSDRNDERTHVDAGCGRVVWSRRRRCFVGSTAHAHVAWYPRRVSNPSLVLLHSLSTTPRDITDWFTVFLCFSFFLVFSYRFFLPFQFFCLGSLISPITVRFLIFIFLLF